MRDYAAVTGNDGCMAAKLDPLIGISYRAVLRERYRNRVPRSLNMLTGPDHGIVQLPLHVAWSGITAFDAGQPRRCVTMYNIVLQEGRSNDITAYVNGRLLREYWPALHQLLPCVVSEVWEESFTELASASWAPVAEAIGWRPRPIDTG